MSKQDNKLIDTLEKFDHIIKQHRKRVESQNTKAHDGPNDYKCHEGHRHRLFRQITQPSSW